MATGSHRLHDYLLLGMGFALTTVVGAHLTNDLQYKSIRKGQQERIYLEVSHTMDDRIYRMRRLLWAYSDKGPTKTVEARLNEYREVLDLWNSSYNRNQGMLHVYFGPEAEVCFVVLHRKFVAIGAELERGGTDGIRDTVEVRRALDRIADEVGKLDRALVRSLPLRGLQPVSELHCTE